MAIYDPQLVIDHSRSFTEVEGRDCVAEPVTLEPGIVIGCRQHAQTGARNLQPFGLALRLPFQWFDLCVVSDGVDRPMNRSTKCCNPVGETIGAHVEYAR